MRVRPPGVSDEEVLDAARRCWDGSIDRVSYAPVGYGAHHWIAWSGSEAALFLTLEARTGSDSRVCLEQAYRAAAALHETGLEFVHPCLPSSLGTLTLAFGDGLLSATAWLSGAVTPAGCGAEAALLRRLHAHTPPPELARWRPLVSPGLADQLATATAERWDGGPFGERARGAVRDRLPAVAGWLTEYLRRIDTVDPNDAVISHGEPGRHNQLLLPSGALVLVDWESIQLAPRERDLAGLAPLDDAWLTAYGRAPDAGLLRCFDIEWRLSEIQHYSARFGGAHGTDEDDMIAFGDLTKKLTRVHRSSVSS